MINRRNFVKSSVLGGVSFLSIPLLGKTIYQETKNPVEYRLTRDVPTKLFDGKKCWVHPRAGIVPGAGKRGLSRVVMTMNTLDLSGSDVFKGMFGLHTDNLGKSWTEPQQLEPLAPRYETIDGVKRPVAAADFWPGFHKASQTLLGTGHTVVYTPDWKVAHPRCRLRTKV